MAADGANFTSFDSFRLGRTSLPAIQRQLGNVAVVHTGDAGDTLYTICYLVGDSAVLFLSGELDGPERSLGGVRVATSTDRTPCKRWPSARPNPKLAVGGIRIGSTREEVHAALGHSVAEEQGKLSRAFITVKRMSASEIRRLPPEAQKQIRSGVLKAEFDVMVSVTVRLEAGRAIEIEVWKTETW
jgi:hypothetical protein